MVGGERRVLPMNQLLAILSEEDRERLLPAMERVTLRQGEILHESLQPIEFVHFLEKGMSSEIALDASGERIEVGCVGDEGFVGVSAILGVDRTPHRSFMETAGAALRIPVPELNRIGAESRTLMPVLLRFVHVFMIQIGATALADGRYSIDQRTARWLLMSQDRLKVDELPLTHEFLSLMLGVRRASVTDALHRLEGDGSIRASRGLIVVRNRRRLEETAGACYGVPEEEYRRVLQPERS